MLAALFALLLVGCGGSGELTYRITGSSGTAEISWTDAEGVTQTETASIPWEKTFEASTSGEYQLSAQRTDGTGISCQALFDGENLGDPAEAQVYASCSGSYDVSGNSRSVSSKNSRDVLPDGSSALPKVGLDALTDSDAGWQDRFERLEFSRYVHNVDCTGVEPELVMVEFEIDYLTDSEVEDCTENSNQNYVDLRSEFDGPGLVFVGIGYNNHPAAEFYGEYAETELTDFPPTITELFDEAELRQEADLTAEVVTFDYDLVDDGLDGFLRIAFVPNFDTRLGATFIMVGSAFGDDLDEEFKLFDAYTTHMLESIEFKDEPLPEPTPTPDPTAVFLEELGNWEDRLARIEFIPYSQDIDCTQYNELFKIQQISLELPKGLTFQDCSANTEAYVAFEADMSAFGIPEIIYIVGRVDHPLDLDGYLEFANGALPSFAETEIVEPYDGTLRDESPLEIGERLFVRHDYDIVREGNEGFARLALVPDFDTGQGLLFIMLSPTITDDLEDEYLLFDATTNRIIDSAQFGGAAPASLTSSGADLLAGIDPAMEVGHLIAFDDQVEAGSIDSFIFFGTEGSNVLINASADESFALALRNVSAEQVLETDAGTDPQISFTLTENAVYQIGIINSSESPLDYVSTFEGDIGISFELRPHFFTFGSYAPEQRLSYLILEAETGDDLVIQALPHPDMDLDLGVDIFSFADSTELLSQDDRGDSEPEEVYYTIGQDGVDPPYVVWVEGVDGEGGIFMLTTNLNGVGQLNVP